MNGDLNFSVSTEGLDDKGTEMDNLMKEYREAIQEIRDAREGLASWQSVNKEKYDSRLERALPKLDELGDVGESYAKVAHQTSRRLNDVEDKIARALEAE